MAKVGFAIVGLGSIAETHAQVIANLKDCYLEAVCSRTMDKAVEFASRHGNPKAFDEVEYMLEDPDVDIVVITTPCGAHLHPAKLALRAGKHVIVEKPIEITLERAMELERIAEEEGVYLTCIFQSRFSESAKLVKKAVGLGRLGRIAMVEAQVKWFRAQSYFEAAPWRGSLELCGGGVLINQAIHEIDLLLYILGKDPVELFAYTDMLTHDAIDVEDVASVVMRFEDGMLGCIMATTGSWPGEPRVIELNGTKGTIRIENDDIVKWEFSDHMDIDDEADRLMHQEKIQLVSSDSKSVNNGAFARQYEEFLDAISKGRDPIVSPRESQRVLAVINAIYESSRAHKAVKLGIGNDNH